MLWKRAVLQTINLFHKKSEFLFPAGLMEKPRVRVRCLQLWLRKLWILSTVDRIFYPLTLYAIYLTFGEYSLVECDEVIWSVSGKSGQL